MSCHTDSDSSDEDELLSYLKPVKVKTPVREEEDTCNIEEILAKSVGQDSQVSTSDRNDLPVADQLSSDLAEINGQSDALTGQLDEESELSKEEIERTGCNEDVNKSIGLPVTDKIPDDLAEINQQINTLTCKLNEDSALSKEDNERSGWNEDLSKTNGLPGTDESSVDLAEINRQSNALTRQLDKESALSNEDKERTGWNDDINKSNGAPVPDEISVDLAEINQQSNASCQCQLDEESVLSKEDSERTGMSENICTENKSDFCQLHSDTGSEGDEIDNISGIDSADLEKVVNAGESSSPFHNDIPCEDPLPEDNSYPSFEIRSNCEAIRKQYDKSTVNEYIPNSVTDFANSKNLESPVRKSTSSRYIMLSEHDFHRLCAIKSVKLPEDITAFENVSRHFITPESSPVKGCASQRKSEVDRSVLKGSKYLISHMEKGNTGSELMDRKISCETSTLSASTDVDETSTSVLADNVECGTQPCNINSTEKAVTQEEKHEPDLSDVEIVFVKLFDDRVDQQPAAGYNEKDLPAGPLPQSVTIPPFSVDLATSLPETETYFTQADTQVDTQSKCVSTVSPINSTHTVQSLPTSTVYPGITNDLVQSHDAVTMAQTQHLIQSLYTTNTGDINAEILNPLTSPAITHPAGPLDSGVVSSMDSTLSVTAQDGNSPSGFCTATAVNTQATSNDLNLSSIETSQIDNLGDVDHRYDSVTISGKCKIDTEQQVCDADLGDENQRLSLQSLKSSGSNEIFESHDLTDEHDEMMEVDRESSGIQSLAGIGKKDSESCGKQGQCIDGIGKIESDSCGNQSQSLAGIGKEDGESCGKQGQCIDGIGKIESDSCGNHSQSFAGIGKEDGDSCGKQGQCIDGIGKIESDSCGKQSQSLAGTGQSPVAVAPRVQVRFERKNNKLTRVVTVESPKVEAAPASPECIVLRLNESGELVRCEDNENPVIDLTNIRNSPCKESNKDHSSLKNLWKSFTPFTSYKRTVKREEEMFSNDESEEENIEHERAVKGEEEMFSSDESEDENISQEYFEHLSDSSGDEELAEYFSGKSGSNGAAVQADYDDVSNDVEYACPSSAPSSVSKPERRKPVEKVNKKQSNEGKSKTVSERKLVQIDNGADSESVSESIGICRNKKIGQQMSMDQSKNGTVKVKTTVKKSGKTTLKVKLPELKKKPNLKDKADNSNTLECDQNSCSKCSTPEVATKYRSKVLVGTITNGSSVVVSKRGNKVTIDGETVDPKVKMKISENEDTEIRMHNQNTAKDCASKDSKLEVQSKTLKSDGTESLPIKSENVKMKRIVRKPIKPKQSALTLNDSRKTRMSAKQKQSSSVSNEARKTIIPALSGQGSKGKEHKDIALKSLAQQVEMKRMKKTRLKGKSQSETKTTRKRKNSDHAADVVKVKRKRMDKPVKVYKKVNGKMIHMCSSSGEISHSPSKTTIVRKQSVKRIRSRRKVKPKCKKVKTKVRLRHHPVLKKCGEITWKEKLSDKIYEVESIENKKPVNVKKMIRQILETPEAKERRRKEKTERKSKHVKSGKVRLKQEVSQLSTPSRVKLTSESDDSETPSQFPAFKFCDGVVKPEATMLINQTVNTEPETAILTNHPKVKTKAFTPKKTVLSPKKTVPSPKQVIVCSTKQSEDVGASCTNKPRVSFNESVTKKCLNTAKVLHSPLKGMIESEAVINENKAGEEVTTKSEGTQCVSPPPKIPCRLQNSIVKLRAMLNIPDRMVRKTQSTSDESQVKQGNR